jgi:hypothetical protein
MANISHFTQTVNGISTTYDIRDANAVDVTSNQTVGGIKTFSNAPVVGSINLDGKTIDTDANGNMTYDSHIVDTIEEQGEGYIRYSNGLQICWGYVARGSEMTKNFPKSFSIPPTVSVTVNGNGANSTNSIATANCTAQAITVYNNVSAYGSFYIAIGRWK